MFNPILIHEFLSRSARLFPDKTALIFNDKKINYKDFDAKTESLAFSLIEAGLMRHDRVVIFLDNCIEVALSIYAVLKAGGIFVCINAKAKADRLKYTIKDSEAKFVITELTNINTIKNAINTGSTDCKLICIGHTKFEDKSLLRSSLKWDDLIDRPFTNKVLDSRKSQIIDYDLATLVYTSGSTGEPKGVMSSHANMIAVSRSVIQYLENTESDIILSVLPVSFVYGLYQLIISVIVGATLVLENSFMFPSKILQIIQKENVTGLPIIPTIAALILKLHGLDGIYLNSLRYITNAGAALPVEHVIRLRTLFPNVKIFSMYGCAECLRVSYMPAEEIDSRPASVGKAIPNCEVFIVDENDFPVGQGEIGELVVRGSNVMRGYWKSPDLTQKVFGRGIMQGEVLLHTGDYFRQDNQGYLFFVCRKDDMIKTCGKRVSPNEIENILCSINGIAESSVIGIPDKILGQAIKAFIVPRDNISLNKNEILRFCAEHLERHMIPKYIDFVDHLPKTLNQKIDKLALKSQIVNI